MSLIAQQLADPVAWLVLAGGGLQASAHLFKNQLVLRLVLLAGTLHYMAYYFAASEQPLWPAIVATTALTVCAVIGLLRTLTEPERVVRRRASVEVCEEETSSGSARLRLVSN